MPGPTPIRSNIPREVLKLMDKAAAAGVRGASPIILAALQDLREDITRAAVAEAVNAGSPAPIFALVDAWDKFRAKLLEAFDPDDGPLIKTMIASARRSEALIPGSVSLEFDAVAERSVIWLRDQGARLVTSVTENTRKSISLLIQDSFASGEDLRRAARRILDVRGFGLTARQAESFEKYVSGLLDPVQGSGLSAKRIQQFMDRRYRKMLKDRARLIARTEAYNAGNAAQGSLWNEAVRQGQLDANAYVMEWVTRAIRVCPRCRALDGKTAEISGGVFVSEPVVGGGFDGQIISVQSPTVHPGCYCVRHLVKRSEAIQEERRAA